MADNNVIQGALTFGSGGAGVDFSGNPANLTANYAAAYNSALSANQTNYNNILAGFQQTARNQGSAQDRIASGYQSAYDTLRDSTLRAAAGYGALQSSVLSGIRDVGASQQQAIDDYYAQQRGQATQSLVDRGLGNTTVVEGVRRGLGLDQQKANVALANQMAQLTAGYQSNLGLAGLNFQNQAAAQLAGQANLGLGYQAQAAAQNTALAQSQLGWMNSVNAPYPNAGLYAGLAQQYGATQQANADRASFDAARQQMAQAAARAGGTPAVPQGATVLGGGEVSPWGPSPGTFGGGGGYQPAGGGFGRIDPSMYGTTAPAAFGGSGYGAQASALYGSAVPHDAADVTGYGPQREADYGDLAGSYDAGGADWLWNALGGGGGYVPDTTETEYGGGY